MINKFYNTSSEIPAFVSKAIIAGHNENNEESVSSPIPYNIDIERVQNVEVGGIYYLISGNFNVVKIDAIIVTEGGVFYYVHTPENKKYCLKYTQLYTKEQYKNIIEKGTSESVDFVDAVDFFDMPREYELKPSYKSIFDRPTMTIVLWRWVNGKPYRESVKYKAFWVDKNGLHFILDVDDETIYYTSREECVKDNLVINDTFNDDEDETDNVEEEYTINISIKVTAKTRQDAINKINKKYGL